MPLRAFWSHIWVFPKVGASGSDVSSLIVEMLGIRSSAKTVESDIQRGMNCVFMQCEVGGTLLSPSVPSPAAAPSLSLASSSDPQPNGMRLRDQERNKANQEARTEIPVGVRLRGSRRGCESTSTTESTSTSTSGGNEWVDVAGVSNSEE